MTELPVQYQNAVEITGQNLRHALSNNPVGEGVDGYEDLRVKPGAAATTVDVIAGTGYVRGDGLADLGLYRCRNDATKNSAAFSAGGLTAPHSTKPRLDMIVARVFDDSVDAGGVHSWTLAVVAGTATTGATLDNREGAGELPASCLHLADVLVPSGAAAVLESSAIRDRRPLSALAVPPLLTDIDMVPLIPLFEMLSIGQGMAFAFDLFQVAQAVYIPRKIVSATKLRWRYKQNAGAALTGNYVLGLFDASGRKIVDTGSVALAGAKGTHQIKADTIAATTFEAGVYYLFMGLDASGSEGAIEYPLTLMSIGSFSSGTPAPNLGLYKTSGGLTVPTTLLGFTDASAGTSAQEVAGVPKCYLSVG